MGEDNTEIQDTERIANKLKKISVFMNAEGMVALDYQRGGCTIRVLDDGNGGVDSGRLGDYLNAYQARERERSEGGIPDNCFEIARRTVNEGRASGRIMADAGVLYFTGYYNHCICYDELNSGRCVAVDLTASRNIDEGAGNFDVLAIAASDLNQLLERVGKLFGGEWFVMQND